MARKSRKNISEVVSSAAIQEEMKRPFRAGLYARISMETEETRERGTIDTQVELMKNFVADTEDISIADVYKDSDYSGTNFERPGFMQMMEDIKQGKINCVIVKDLSRLGRNYVETSNYIERVFPFFHVRFLAVTDDFDSFREGVDLTVPLKNIIKNISHSGKVSNDFSLFRRFCCINRCFRCSCGKFSIVHGVQAAIGFQAVAIGEKGDLPETHPVQPRTESKRPCRLTRAKPASKGSDRALSV